MSVIPSRIHSGAVKKSLLRCRACGSCGVSEDWGVGKEIDCCDAVRAFRFGFPSSEGVLVLWSCDSVLK